jgi:predicted Ser/Thr protein kinase
VSAKRDDRTTPEWTGPAESTFDPDGGEGAEGLAFEPAFEPLGRGAGGVVLGGRDRHLPRTVAWKVARGAKAKARLAHEARVLAALEHPGVVPIHDLVEGHDDSLRIALRKVRGETLHTLVRRAPNLTERLRLLRPFLQAVDAVAWAHRIGWVHCDLKPANIMVGEFGETQVIDWGLAQHLDETSENPGAVVGTLSMMCPEQARGEAPTPSFDVWGLGVTLFEILSGHSLHPPREAFPGGPSALAAQVRLGHHPPIAPACPGAPAELIAIVERCLARTPEDRYRDARALGLDLTAFLDGRQVAAHDYNAFELFARFVRAWRMPLAIGLAALLTGAVAAIVAFERISEERDRALTAHDEAQVALAERDLQLARSGEIEARRELADDQRPEAELAAARTLDVHESPEARGVLAAFARAPRFARASTRAMPFRCLDIAVSPDGRHTLCGSRDALVVFEGESLRWTWRHPYRGAVFIGGGSHVLVAPTEGDVLALDTRDGAVARTYPPSTCFGAGAPRRRGGLFASERTQTYGLATSHVCAEAYATEGSTVLDPCLGRHIEVISLDATPDGMRAAGLCVGGDLFVQAPDGTRVAFRTPIGDAADTLLASSFFGPDALIVGSSRGVLSVINLADGSIRARRTLPLAEAIRGFAVAPELDRLVVASEGQGLLVSAFATLAPIARLPRDAREIVALDVARGGTLLTYGDELSRWALAPGPPARFEGLGGITSVVHDGRTLVVTHDNTAVVMDPADGRVAAEVAWDKVVAKQAVLEGETLRVAISGRLGGEPIVSAETSAGLGHDEVPAMRRVALLSGGRKVGARTGKGLVYWPTPDAEWELIAYARVKELSVRGDVAAVLFDDPEVVAAVYDLGTAPLELARCTMPWASDVALTRSLGDSEPLLLAATPSGVIAYRLEPPDLAPSECPMLARYSAPSGELVRVAATRDGRYVGGATREGTVHVWQADGRLVASVPLHESSVTTFSVDPDDRWFISGAWDGRVRFLSTDVLAVTRQSLVEAIHAAWGRTSTR